MRDQRLWTLHAGDERVRVMDRDEVVIGSVRFLNTTMWTDFAAAGNTSTGKVGCCSRFLRPSCLFDGISGDAA